MPGRDQNFLKGVRAQERHEGRFAREVDRTRSSPDEVLELYNFAVGAALISGEPGRQAIQFVLPTGRQVIAKMSHENAVNLARAIDTNVEIDAGERDVDEASENGSEQPGS